MNKNVFLIDRMSIENVNKLLKYSKKYPNSGESLINELCNKEYWTNLTYEYVCALNDALDCGFHPTNIDNLFKK